jgi:aryl-alcohol dehydrogenase-like predicted oxidoreductase
MSTARGADGVPDERESLLTLNRALELGITFFDTADVYGLHHNESLLGQLLSTRRSEIEIATKFGLLSDQPGRQVDGRPQRVAQCCDESLKRLQVDTIDLYYLHRVDPTVPIEETIGAMAELITVGKVRYLGLSEVGVTTLRRAHAVHPITALQSEYSLWSRHPERDVLPVANELGIGFVAFAPLGRGFLTGSIAELNDLPNGDVRRDMPRFSEENFSTNRTMLQQVEEMALEMGVSVAQLTLAWLLSRRPRVVPIPGTISRDRLAENAHSTTLNLTTNDLERLEATMPSELVAGDRYGESLLRLTNG